MGEIVPIPDEVKRLSMLVAAREADLNEARAELLAAKHALARFKPGDAVLARVDIRGRDRGWRKCIVNRASVTRLIDHEHFSISYTVRPILASGKPAKRTHFAADDSIKPYEEGDTDVAVHP